MDADVKTCVYLVKSSEVDKGCENSINTYFAVILDQNYCRSL